MPEDQQSSVLIEATEEHDAKRKNLSRILTAWKRLKRILAILGKPVSDTLPREQNPTKHCILPSGLGSFAQFFFDVFTSKEEILRPTLVLPHFGHFSFLALRSYSLMV
jgi:hypothetical protein